jgi:asparagine synthase (glutamine-hydrolysing)
MCGICGKVNFDGSRPIERELLQNMTQAIAHRGPDGVGEYRRGPVGLGHRRLSIIDLTTGDQPMCNEDGTIWLVFNGEIYNFQELRALLVSRGHRFKSSSDTEVIVHLYEEYGRECVSRLRGMFSFALWDEPKRSLLLARDPVGIKPLYYTNTSRSLVFGSELKCILTDPEVERRVNVRAIDRFLTYYYGAGSETPFESIYKLEPGHFLTVIDGKVTKTKYWDLRFGDKRSEASFADTVCELQGLLRQSVKDHLISDVPVGVLLSGGVDSTAVLRYASEESSNRLHSFTIGFSGERFADERPYAALAAQLYGTRHNEVTLTPEDFGRSLLDYVWHMEELVCEPPAIALYALSRLARASGVKVLLSGEGGDEAFGGYQTYRNNMLLERLKTALGPARPLFRSTLVATAKLGWKRIDPYIEMMDALPPQYYFSRTATPATPFNRMKSSLFRPEILSALQKHDSTEVTRKLFDEVKGGALLDQMLYVDTKTWLPDDLLVKADKMTMAASTELRVPLLDTRVLEFAASLPVKFKVRGWSGKRVLRAALKTTVPQAILNRPKTGFPVPYTRWLQTDLKDFVRDTVLAPNAGLKNYFKATVLDSIVEEFHQNGTGSKEVFCLVVLELWLQRFTNVGRGEVSDPHKPLVVWPTRHADVPA